MNARTLLTGLLLFAAAGCQSPPEPPATAPAASRMDKSRSVEFTPGDDAFIQRRAAARTPRNPDPAVLTEGELVELPKLMVTARGFLNLGMSVVTNTEVLHEGPIEWMRVGVVLPDSAAARAGLVTGVEILAIDGLPVARLSRDAMLHSLFERAPGDRVRVLVYSRLLGPLPRFVTLGALPKPAK